MNMKEIEEEKISFDTGLLAKEKGFDIPCDHFYVKPNSKMFAFDEKGRAYPIKRAAKNLYIIGQHATLNDNNVYWAPTQAHLQRWIREVHNIVVEVLVFDIGFLETDKFCYQWRMHVKLDNGDVDPNWFTGLEFTTYELALEAALKEGLKQIKSI